MTTDKVNALMMQLQNKIPEEQAAVLKNALVRATDESYDVVSTLSLKSSTTTLLFSIFLGGFGVDRFYIGDTGVGVAKLLFGWLTFGIWPFIDIFISYKRAKAKNLNKILAAAV